MDKSNIFDLGSILDKNIQKPELPVEQHTALDTHKLKSEPVYIQSNPLIYKSNQPFSQKLKMLNVVDPNAKMRSTGIRTSATIDSLIYKEVPKNEWLLIPTNTYIRVLYNDNTTSAGGRMTSLSPVGDGTYTINIRHKNPKNLSTSTVNTDDINKLYKLINDKKEMQKGTQEMPTIQEVQPMRQLEVQPMRQLEVQPMRQLEVQPMRQTEMQPMRQLEAQPEMHDMNHHIQGHNNLSQPRQIPMNTSFNDTNESITSLNFRVDTIEIKIQRIEQSINKIIELLKERIVK